MKKVILSLVVLSLMSTNAFAKLDKSEMSSLGAGMAGWGLFSSFVPVVGGALLVSGSSAFGLMSSLDASGKAKIQAAVNNDAQQFYQDGTLSPALSFSVESLKELDQTLTDADAVDILVETINQ